MLNQRGGRTLSIVDLIGAGTISVDMAAYAMRAVYHGASTLTGAVPGGAGKTTLMAALLNFLPPDVPIVTVDRPELISDGFRRDPQRAACYLVHEIGSGHWYGYLWGRHVAEYLRLIDGNRRIASCLHADTLDELTDILCSAPLHVRPEDLGRVSLVLFMHVDRASGGIRRRVAAFHEAQGDGHRRLRFRWDARADKLETVGELPDADELEPYREFLAELVARNEFEAQAVRRRVLEFYRRRP
jgi:hypothetical protein